MPHAARPARRLAVLGTLTAVAALTLTACQSDGTASTASSAAPATAPASSAPAASAPASTAPVSPAPAAGTTAPGGGGTTTAAGACTPGMLTFSVLPVREPVDYVAIRATNHSSAPCVLYTYPELGLGSTQKASIGIEGGASPASLRVPPGGSAYAALRASSADGSGSSSGNHVSVLGVALRGRDGGPGPSTRVPVPGGQLYVEPSTAAVTYWQSALAAALSR